MSTSSGEKNESRSRTGKPRVNYAYGITSFAMNLIMGMLGIGAGFLFFLSMVVTSGEPLLRILFILLAALVTAALLWIIYKANRGLLRLYCGRRNMNSKRNQLRIYVSMLWAAAVLAGSMAYSFLRALVAVKSQS